MKLVSAIVSVMIISWAVVMMSVITIMAVASFPAFVAASFMVMAIEFGWGSCVGNIKCNKG